MNNSEFYEKPSLSFDWKSIDSTCRVCLKQNCVMSVSIFHSAADSVAPLKQIISIANVDIKSSDGLPATICQLCYCDLKSAISFKKKCEKSDKFMRTCLPDLITESKQILDDNVSQATQDIPTEGEVHNDTVEFEEIKLEIDGDEQSEVESDSHLNDDSKFKQSVKSNSKDGETNEEKCLIYQCLLCGKPLKSKLSLKKHLRCMHDPARSKKGKVTGFGANRRYHCTECPYTTPHSQSLVYHIRIHTGERPYKCDVCDKSFTQPGSLASHKKVHSEQTYYTCSDCGRQFKYKETYEKHKNVHVADKKFICKICGKGLKSVQTLGDHMKRHYNIKDYRCELCGDAFVTHVELLNHGKKHSGDRNFKCHLCEYSTYLKKGLDTHLMRHTGERPFQCDECDRACYTAGELKCHKRRHTKERNYECPVCLQRFVHSSSVNKHARNTHGLNYCRNAIVDRRVVK